MVEDIKQSIVNCTVCEIDSPAQSNESQLTHGISREKVEMDLFSWKEKEYLNSRLQGTWFQLKYTPMGFPLESVPGVCLDVIFEHTMSSPYLSQSYGKVTSAVRIATRELKRNADPYMAFLE